MPLYDIHEAAFDIANALHDKRCANVSGLGSGAAIVPKAPPTCAVVEAIPPARPIKAGAVHRQQTVQLPALGDVQGYDVFPTREGSPA